MSKSRLPKLPSKASDYLTPKHREAYARQMRQVSESLQQVPLQLLAATAAGLEGIRTPDLARSAMAAMAENDSDLPLVIIECARLFIISHLEALAQAETKGDSDVPKQ